MMSVVSPSSTTRRTLTRGRSRSSTRVMIAEESVAADREPEQLGMRVPRACAELTVGPSRSNASTCSTIGFRFNPRPCALQDSAPAEAQAIRAGLLLIDSPLPGPAFLRLVQIADQLRPLNAAFDRDHAAFGVEREHAVDDARIDEHAPLAELLAAHRVTAAGDRDRPCPGPWLEQPPPEAD